MDSRRAWTMFLALSTLATTRCIAEDYFLRAREPAPNLYLFGGMDFSQSHDGTRKTAGIPLELRIVDQNDWEFSVQGSVIHEDHQDWDTYESGDTVVSFGKGFRPRQPKDQNDLTMFEQKFEDCDLVSFDLGYVFDGSRTAPPRGDEAFGRVRAQGGWTRAGFDVSLMASTPTRHQGTAEPAITLSTGYRGQFGRYHLGVDFITQRRDSSVDHNRQWADVVLMRRASRTSYYGIASKRLSSHSDELYVGFGAEVRFESIAGGAH